MVLLLCHVPKMQQKCIPRDTFRNSPQAFRKVASFQILFRLHSISQLWRSSQNEKLDYWKIGWKWSREETEKKGYGKLFLGDMSEGHHRRDPFWKPGLLGETAICSPLTMIVNVSPNIHQERRASEYWVAIEQKLALSQTNQSTWLASLLQASPSTRHGCHSKRRQQRIVNVKMLHLACSKLWYWLPY